MSGDIMEDNLLAELSRFLSVHMGLRFPPERLADLSRGMASAAAEFGFTDPENCARWLMEAPLSRRQVEILASHLTIGETYFFRDPKTFETLERLVLPPLVGGRRRNGRYLRIWCAGCATGEEPYTVAIVVSRLIPDLKEWKISILGTDINPAFLRKAKEGVYGEWSFRSVPLSVRERYFSPAAPRQYRIDHRLKESVIFSYLNLAEDVYPSLVNGTNAMDIIFCRNVLMYLSTEIQAAVVGKFHRCLVPHGLLVVSPSETSPVSFAPFSDTKLPGKAFYRKRAAVPSGDSRPGAAFPPPASARREASIEPARSPAEKSAQHGKRSGLYAGAVELYERGFYEEAENKLEGLPEGTEADCATLVLMAKLEANLGRLQSAREYCRKAINCDRLNAALYVLMGTILQEMDLPEEQDTALKQALYLDQECVVAHFARGNLAARRKAPREAERHYGNALAVLERMGRDEVVPLSEGVTAGRMREVIMMALSGKSMA